MAKYRQGLLKIAIIAVIFSYLVQSNYAQIEDTAWQNHSRAGKQAFEQKKFDDAEKAFLKALKEVEKANPPDARLIASLQNLTAVYQFKQQFDKAEKYCERSLALREQLLGVEHPETIANRETLAVIYYRRRQIDKARKLFQQVLESRDRLNTHETAEQAATLISLSNLYLSQLNFSQTEEALKSALEIRIKVFGNDHAQVADILDRLSALYFAWNKNKESSEYYKQAVATMRRAINANSNNSEQTDDEIATATEGATIQSPKIIAKLRPDYTEEARKNKISGMVILRVIFRKDGKITDIRLLKGLGYGLDESSIQAAALIQFEPGTKDGKKVNVQARLEYSFSLSNN